MSSLHEGVMSLFGLHRERSESGAQHSAPATVPGGDGLASSCVDAPGIGAADAAPALLSRLQLAEIASRERIARGGIGIVRLECRAPAEHADKLRAVSAFVRNAYKDVPALLDHIDALGVLAADSTDEIAALHQLADGQAAEIGELRDELRETQAKLRRILDERLNVAIAQLQRKED